MAPCRKKLAAAAAVVILLSENAEEEKEEKPSRTHWVKPYLMRRGEQINEVLLKELKENNSENYNLFLGMNEDTFNRLFELCKPFIETKKDTLIRKSITQKERLVATLVYLSSGKPFRDLQTLLAISSQSLYRIVPQACSAIVTALEAYMKLPSTEEEWKKVSQDFKEKWGFPNCVGAIGGKHVKFQPFQSLDEYQYFNYLDSKSVILIAAVDANLEFILANVEAGGSLSGQEALENTEFYARLREKTLKLPRREDNANGLSSVFIGEEMFALHENFLTPFSLVELSEERSVYNYRLSRARQCVENTFRILSNRFNVFRSVFRMSVSKVQNIVLASCLLHNFMMRECRERYARDFHVDEDVEYSSSIVIDSSLTEADPVAEVAFAPLQKEVQNSSDVAAAAVRKEYVEFFNNIGRLK